METINLSLVLTLFGFFLSGLPIFRLFQIKNWLFPRVLADYFSLKGKNYFLNKKDILVLIFVLYLLLGLENYLHLFFTLFNLWFNLIFEIASFIFPLLPSLAEFLTLNSFYLFFLVLTLGLFLIRLPLLKNIQITPKALILLFLFLFLNFSFIYLSKNDPLIVALIFISYFQIAFFVLALMLFEILVSPYLWLLRRRVERKLKKLEIKKIVIVGSYGKSSLKEILVYLLQNKKILSLPPRINHEYSILKFLLRQKLENYDYLVLELGSYFLGNIAWLTKAIIPDYVFITGITKQHYFLFGERMENVIWAEGLEALQWMKKGKVFINSNHEYFAKLKEEIEKNFKNKELKIITYGKQGDYSYEILSSELEKTIFKLKIGEDSHLLETNLFYPPQIENLVGALTFVLEEKILNLEEIGEKIKNISLPSTFLQVKFIKNFVIFDDSYNANLKGVVEGLKYFQELNLDKKIVIFNGLLELGRETKKIYRELAQLFQNLDVLVLTQPEEYHFFKKLIPQKVFFPRKQEDLDNFLEKFKEKTGVFIFNRFPRGLKLKLGDEKAN